MEDERAGEPYMTEAVPHGGRLALALLRAENQRLRAQIEGMLGEARLNQEKMQRFDRLERQIIGAPSLAALIRILLEDYRTLFGLDAVTLALVDPSHEVGRMLNSPEEQTETLLLLDDGLRLHALYAGASKPLLVSLNEAHAFLFEGAASGLSTAALLPLLHHGRCIGSLNLGSREALRFEAGSSTDFLERLAGLVAVCLDSALSTERLKLAGLTDALTGVYNRRYFEARCTEEVVAARRSGQSLTCLFLDIDHFKRLNDGHGHQTGDDVLAYVARLIKAQLRGSDVVARYGGEEFVVLLPATPQSVALEIAERMRRIVEAQTMAARSGEVLRVSVSIGVAMLQPQGEDTARMAADMVARADQALYQAKAGGRNQVAAAD